MGGLYFLSGMQGRGCIIDFGVEVKIDSTPEEAIKQIKERQYALRFRGKLGEKEKYMGRILAVGISYDRKSKEHFCGVEMI